MSRTFVHTLLCVSVGNHGELATRGRSDGDERLPSLRTRLRCMTKRTLVQRLSQTEPRRCGPCPNTNHLRHTCRTVRATQERSCICDQKCFGVQTSQAANTDADRSPAPNLLLLVWLSQAHTSKKFSNAASREQLAASTNVHRPEVLPPMDLSCSYRNVRFRAQTRPGGTAATQVPPCLTSGVTAPNPDLIRTAHA